MALPVLDGNQSATTLSSVVTGGEHIVAHSVVCLGSTAIANITNAVSGSVVSISNFPSTQTIAGTVTANISSIPNVLLTGSSGDPINDGGSIPVFLVQAGEIYGTVTVGNSVTISSLPAISGTVTANLANVVTTDLFWNTQAIKITGGNGYGIDIAGEDANGNRAIFDEGGGVPVFPREFSGNFPIAGTVTIGNSVTIGSLPAISGTVTANASLQNSNSVAQAFIDESNSYGSLSVVLSGSAADIGVVGTVTAAAPNGSLTTRFGTPTTANVSFATAAVTKSDRKYLLIQNVTTGSNVITVGIGFTPTTTRGIQLTAGAGITFESSYIPTGAVYVLSSVTASNFTILEA